MRGSKHITQAVAYGIIAAFLVYFVALPVISVLVYGLGSGGGLFFQTGGLDKIMESLINSLAVSVTVTAIATAVGLMLSFTLNRIRFRGRGLMRIVALLPFVNPPFVGSISYIMLFGKRGLISHDLLGLSVSAYGYKGILVIQVLGLSSLAYLLISSAIKKIDTTLEDAARNIGATETRVFFTVTLPMMLPEISGTALLVFLASMADFSTPLIIGGSFQTLASQLYIQITGLYDMTSAAVSGLVLFIPCIIVFLLQKYYVSRRTYFSDESPSVDIEYKYIGKKTRRVLILLCALFLALVLMKYLFIVIGALTKSWGHDYSLTLDHIRAIGGRKYKPFINSFKLASLSALIGAASGVVLAYLIRMRQMKWGVFADFLATLPAAIPGILFGIGYLVTFKYPILGVGRFWLTGTRGAVLLGTGSIIYLICIARFMNTGLRSGYALLEHVHPDIEMASYNLGAGGIQTFIRIMAPMMKDAFFASFLKSYSSGMVTLGAIILLLIPSNKVAVQQIFQIITSSKTGAGAAMALMLSFMTLLFLGFYYVLFYLNDLIRACRHMQRRSREYKN